MTLIPHEITDDCQSSSSSSSSSIRLAQDVHASGSHVNDAVFPQDQKVAVQLLPQPGGVSSGHAASLGECAVLGSPGVCALQSIFPPKPEFVNSFLCHRTGPGAGSCREKPVST